MSTLEASIRAIDGAGVKTDIGQLQNDVKAVITVLKDIESDVINVLSNTHVVIEAARGRYRKLEVRSTSFCQSNIMFSVTYISISLISVSVVTLLEPIAH